jgi:hypothetical protein
LLANEQAAGTPFYYKDLPYDHSARAYAREVAGFDPAEAQQ